MSNDFHPEVREPLASHPAGLILDPVNVFWCEPTAPKLKVNGRHFA
jgi:hypothetical protein